jgi:hypothetical protein
VSQRALLKRIVEALAQAGVAYMLTGSLASSVQGEPRATHDIDFVIDLSPDDAHGVIAALVAADNAALVAPDTAALVASSIYIDEGAVVEATRRRSMFNLIDTASGDKADLWLLTDDPYDRTRFARRIRVSALGLDLSVSAPEDTILMKLRWSAQAAGRERQLNDAIHVYELQAGTLDEAYLDEWAVRLGVADVLAAIRQQTHGDRPDAI